MMRRDARQVRGQQEALATEADIAVVVHRPLELDHRCGR